MGIAERKIREREERRHVIIDNTRALILERGVEAVTMLDIARKSELSKATLYLYFKSKEAILEEILSEATTYFVEYVESRLTPSDSGITAIRTLWMSYLEVFGEAGEIFVMFGIKNYIAPTFPLVIDESDEFKKKPMYRLFRLIVRILERGLSDETLDPSLDPEKIARTVLILSGGIIDNIARLPGGVRDTKLIQTEMRSTFEIILRGLASERCDRSLLVLAEVK